jgi:hypothetical protein
MPPSRVSVTMNAEAEVGDIAAGRRTPMSQNMPKLGTMLMAAVIATWVSLVVPPAFTKEKDTDHDGVPDPIDRCPETVIPEVTAPTVRLKVSHFALTTGDTTFDTWRRHRPPLPRPTRLGGAASKSWHSWTLGKSTRSLAAA